jgi:hypothetical protein
MLLLNEEVALDENAALKKQKKLASDTWCRCASHTAAAQPQKYWPYAKPSLKVNG